MACVAAGLLVTATTLLGPGGCVLQSAGHEVDVVRARGEGLDLGIPRDRLGRPVRILAAELRLVAVELAPCPEPSSEDATPRAARSFREDPAFRLLRGPLRLLGPSPAQAHLAGVLGDEPGGARSIDLLAPHPEAEAPLAHLYPAPGDYCGARVRLGPGSPDEGGEPISRPAIRLGVDTGDGLRMLEAIGEVDFEVALAPPGRPLHLDESRPDRRTLRLSLPVQGLVAELDLREMTSAPAEQVATRLEDVLRRQARLEAVPGER